MSLLDQLHHRGVTTEDLEKAAAVRLFEKAASAEGVNLDELSEDVVTDLFNHFVATNQATKEASAMNDEIVELFEKTAAAEGIDLEDMSDEELAELYNHYVENVLPEQIEAVEGEKAASANEAVVEMFQKTASAEGIDLSEFDEEELEGLFAHYVENVLPLQLGDADATDKVADAQEKLAEAEILGRHMARAYMDELNKVASAESEEIPEVTIQALEMIANSFGEDVLDDVLNIKVATAAAGTARSLGGQLGDMLTGAKQAVRGAAGSGNEFVRNRAADLKDFAQAIRADTAANPSMISPETVRAIQDAGAATRGAAAEVGAAAAQSRAATKQDVSTIREALGIPKKDKPMSTNRKLAIGGGVAAGLGGLGALKYMSDKEASATSRAKELLLGSSSLGKRAKKRGLMSAAASKGSSKVSTEARKVLATRAGAAGTVGAVGGAGAYALKRRNDGQASKMASADFAVAQEAARLLAIAGYDV